MSGKTKAWSFMRQSVNSPYPWVKDPRWGTPKAFFSHPTAVVPYNYWEFTRRSTTYLAFAATFAVYAGSYHSRLGEYLRKPGAFVINDNGIAMPTSSPTFFGQPILPVSVQDGFAKKIMNKEQTAALKKAMAKSMCAGCV